MENQQNKTTWPQSSDMDCIPALSSIREPPPHSPGSSKVWLSLLCSYLSAFGLREDERHFGSSLMGGAASRKASAFAARLNVFSREGDVFPAHSLSHLPPPGIFPLYHGSLSSHSLRDLPASGTYLLPLLMLVETESKSSKTHLWSQNLKVEARGSEVHGHFQIHDKFKASLGYMRCCLRKKKTPK